MTSAGAPGGGFRLKGIASLLRLGLVAVLCLALIALTVLGLRINDALSDLKSRASDSLHWNLSQLEVDLVRLGEEVQLCINQDDRGLEELRKRFDLFYSRAQNAIQGSGYASPGLEEISDDIADALNDFLEIETPVIDIADPVLRAHLPVMADSLAELRNDLRKLTIDMFERLAELNDERREAFGVLVRQMAYGTAATISMLLVLLAVVVWLNRLAGREAQQTAQISRQLASTVDSALDAIVVADENGRIIQFNPSAEAIFGYSRDEAIGRPVGELIVPHGHRAAHAVGMERMKRGGGYHVVNAGRIQISALNRSGREFPVELSISSAEGERGRFFVAFLRDISDRLAAEAALTRARDEALAAERTKTEFLAVMSHEMRTPLNEVVASLEIASQMAQEPELKRFIALASDSAALLLRHANDVLDITRLEGGRLDLSVESFDLYGHLSGLVEAVRPICDEKGIALSFQMFGERPMLRGDPFRLGQILQNFLSNAIKFVDAGGITVEADVSEAWPGLRQLELRVIDTGPGIAEADQERIFDDFVMVDPTFQHVRGGAGLGLAISRRLAQAMSGEIGVESELGEGSCFWLRVTLPLAEAEASQAKEAHSPPAPPTHPAQEVLVVEDNATNRAVLDEMLRRLGQKVTMASDGAIGAALASEQQFDLILMDISMPVMDGMTAARLIRTRGASRKSRIVAVTAHSLPGDLARIRDAGMDDVLVKPISSEALRRILAGSASAAAAPQAAAILDPNRLEDLRSALDPEGFQRTARALLRDLPVHFARLNDAMQTPGTGDDPIAICHEAAGLAAVFGAERLRGQLSTAETLLREGRQDAARDLLRLAADTTLPETEAALRKLLPH